MHPSISSEQTPTHRLNAIHVTHGLDDEMQKVNKLKHFKSLEILHMHSKYEAMNSANREQRIVNRQ